MDFIRAVDGAAARKRDGVVVACAALGSHQIVPAVVEIQVRRFRQADIGAEEDIFRLADEFLFLRGIFLKQDAGKRVASVLRAPAHIDEPFAAVAVVEQGRIEAAAVELDRLAPRAAHVRRSDEVVDHVLGDEAVLHVRIDQPEHPVGVGEARRPHAGGIGSAPHIELAFPRQRMGNELPVGEILRVVDLHAREPLECGGSDVVVVTHAADRRIGIEPF